ncbi:MAG TPA: hypothetical protein VFM18_22255 [Methanosarcina sp.]|nr:hypothetical protein [Methanosarcina sp.]
MTIVKTDKLAEVLQSLRMMQSKAVFVGIPLSSDRKDDSLGNAQIAFIQEFGSDHANIPARPFLRPAIASIKYRVIQELKTGAKLALQGQDMHISYEKAGLIGQSAVKKWIVSGEGFEPLKPSTLYSRQRRRKSTTAGTKPLIDTGQMLNSITYVIKDI